MLSTPLLVGALLASGFPPSAPPPSDGAALLKTMYDRYAGKWYHTATFVQTTTFPTQNRVETWYEAMTVPGFLRIDIAPLDSGNAIVFRNDSVYRVRGGKVAASRDFVHPLMVLGFDVYALPATRTAERLTALGFDLSKLREDTWQGRPVYVVGAEPGDTVTNQFWVDRERLVFVRMLEPAPGGQGTVAETRFDKYQACGKGWMAVAVSFTIDGQMQQKEEYADVRCGVKLPKGLFELEPWTAPGWTRE